MKTEEPKEFAKAVKLEVDLQDAFKNHDEVSRGVPFLWDGLKLLSEADFASAPDSQMDLFGNECEGMCGV